MDVFIQHIVLAARNRDGDDWMNILFLVFVMILYVIGGLVKKIKDHKITFGEEKKERVPPRPSRAVKKPVDVKPHPAVVKHPSVAFDKERIRKAPSKAIPQKAVAYRPDMYKGQQVDEIEKTITELETEVKLPEVDTLAVEKPKDIKVEEKVLQDLVTLDEPDDFARAFLYYEIFGKPLSLRKETGTVGLNP
jgi:hypothetical protein